MNERVAILPDESDSFDFGGLGVVWKIEGQGTEGRFSVVHHPLAPHALAAPLHYHHNEDEYSYVLQGTLGAMLGDEVVTAGPGTWVFKPRHQWHTFWNAADAPARLLEIISPAGFKEYFRELVELGGSTRMQPQARAALAHRYGLEVNPACIPGLVQRFGLRFPGKPVL